SRSVLRSGAFGLAVVAPVGIAIFAVQGPLAHGWARRAGTPAKLLGPSAAGAPASAQIPKTTTQPPPVDPASRPFTDRMSGTVSQTATSGGAIIQLQLRLNGHVQGTLRVRLGGQPLPSGGLSL